MTVQLKTSSRTLLCGCALALVSSCAYRPPQTGFYCVDIPEGRSGEASQFVQTVAHRLDFKVSQAQFPGFMENGPPQRVWDVYGGGVSLFVGTAMKDGKSDRFGNIETTFNPHRLGLHVYRTSLWQRVRFDEVLITARDTARQLGWRFTKAPTGKSCAT